MARSAVSIPKDDGFHILQNARRRAVLRYLLEHAGQEQFVMRDVAEEVAAWEHNTTIRQLSSDERQRVHIALYQKHLPKLDNYGVIEYDQNRGSIEPTPLIHVFAPYLDDGLHGEANELTVSDDPTSHTTLSSAVQTIFSRYLVT